MTPYLNRENLSVGWFNGDALVVSSLLKSSRRKSLGSGHASNDLWQWTHNLTCRISTCPQRLSMSGVDAEQADRELEEILAWNPPILTQSSKPGPALTIPPRAFYDKHIDSKLLLHRVVALDSLVADIAKVASDHSASISEGGLHLLLPSEGVTTLHQYNRSRSTVVDATDVANFYKKGAAKLCLGVATKLFLAPRSPEYMEIPMWLRRFGATGKTSSALDDGYVLCMPEESGQLDLDEEDRELMDEPMITRLTTLVDRHPNIGNWQILSVSPESNALLNNLGRVTESDTFPFKTCRTSGFPLRTSARVLPADVSAPLWRLPASGSEREPTNGSIPLTPRRSKRLSTSAAPMATRTLSTATRVKPAALRRPRDSSHVDIDVTPEASVQLAWCRAVRSDSTVIVFHNGNLERIGIRHRESQTLYLSDLIDVQNCKDPGYAKLHTGLYIAMMSDAINRVTEESSEPGKGKGKRGLADPGPGVAVKRRKITRTEELETKSATEVASARNFVLLNIQYGVYDSPVPASFIRSAPSLPGLPVDASFTLPPVKRQYHESEYITITLTSELGSGATGVAHAAILHVTTKDGKTLEEDVVVKVAFLAEQQQRMRHEYETYRRLAKFSVEGVPKVFGLFDDLEGGTVVLVMSPCGDCLWKLRPNPKDTKVTLSPEQRAQFIAILQDIHRAGVQHHDIRPQNLMLTPSGEPFIVDFDRSTFDPSAGRKRREVERLTDLFEGSYHDPKMMSLPTTPEPNNEDAD